MIVRPSPRLPGRPVCAAALVSLLALVACSDVPPTAPERVLPESVEAAPQALAPEDRAGLLIALEDARTRLLPALGDDVDIQALDAPLAGLAAALSAGERPELRRSLAQARAALDGVQAASPDLVHTAAIALVLARVESLTLPRIEAHELPVAAPAPARN